MILVLSFFLFVCLFVLCGVSLGIWVLCVGIDGRILRKGSVDEGGVCPINREGADELWCHDPQRLRWLLRLLKL